MASSSLVKRLKQGTDSWNIWRKRNPRVPLDLSNADLFDVFLSYADLKEVDLSKANLSEADLYGTDLYDANLSSADLSKANLSFANLDSANLSNANLSGALLAGAFLYNANLSGANLGGATLINTNLGAIDLRATKGLAEIKHAGPSHIDLHAIQLSQDGSAPHFLRGVGISDPWINFWCTEMIHPIQYHSLFISHSNKDEMLAHRLHNDLQAHGVRCWFAPEDLKTGDKIRVRIDEAIHLQDKLLLLLSEHALASAWVEDEVEAAMEKENQQQREVLFPVRLDDAVMQTIQAWAAKLRRTRHIGDFTRWTDPQEYQQAFARLLRDLKTES